VEDDPTNRVIVCAMLEDAGCRVDTCEGGWQALERLARESFDVVLMDWQMPELDGLEVTRRVRRGDAGAVAQAVPIVALTANAFAEDRAACLDAGMDDFLTKPVHLQALQSAVARWASVGRRRARRHGGPTPAPDTAPAEPA
jgi:CheY-like chemotaxis protein